MSTLQPISIPWLEKLIRFDTTSFKSNLDLIHCIEDYLSSYQISSTLTFEPSGKKANLFATIPAHDGTTNGGIVLSGHTDVVPVKGQKWDTDPFEPVIKDGLLYGRGACDMKGFIAVVLALLPEILEQPLKEPIHLAFSCDEEIGCVGAPYMLADLKARGVHANGCIVGEPTSMGIVVAHKGINAYRCSVHGQAAHSSLTPLGTNAIEYAARLICFIRDLADHMRANGPQDPYFDVPYTTLQTGTIQGGIAINTIPDLCEFNFEFRNLPGTNSQEIIEKIKEYAEHTLLTQMRSEHENSNIEFTPIASAPPLNAQEESAITQLVRDLTQDQKIRKVAYGTEAGLFEELGIPSIVCGPGNIEQAHKPNEFVPLEQLQLCEDFIRRLVHGMRI